MKVLHIIWDLGQGGAQTYLLNLVTEQAKDPDLESGLLVLTERGALSDDFDRLTTTQYVGMSSGLSLLASFRILRRIHHFKASLIHVHSNNLLLQCMLHFTRQPIVYTEHGGGLLGGRRQDRIIYKYLYRPVSRWIAISGFMAETMRTTNPSAQITIDLVYNGVNIDQISPRESEEDSVYEQLTKARFCVGIIGRLHQQKGIDLFLRTAAHLAEQIEDIVFVVVGDGQMRAPLEDLAEELGVREQVLFLGYRKDAMQLLRRFTVFVFTSAFEPFGLVIAEAMAARVPVVAVHTVGAVPEIIENDVDGIIVLDRDPARVSGAVLALLNDVGTRQRLCQEASVKVRARFSIQSNARAVKDVYGRAT